MKRIITQMALASAIALPTPGMIACTADVHDNTLDVHDNTATIDDAKIEMETTADVENVSPGEEIQVTVDAENVYLVDPDEAPPEEEEQVAGHLEFFLDSTSSEPLLVTAEQSVTLMIPEDTPEGEHKLLCRVKKHDGTPTTATFEMNITVTASATTEL